MRDENKGRVANLASQWYCPHLMHATLVNGHTVEGDPCSKDKQLQAVDKEEHLEGWDIVHFFRSYPAADAALRR